MRHLQHQCRIRKIKKAPGSLKTPIRVLPKDTPFANDVQPFLEENDADPDSLLTSALYKDSTSEL